MPTGTERAGGCGDDVDLRHHGDQDVAPGLVDLAVNVRWGAPPRWLVDTVGGALVNLAAYPDPRDARRTVAALHHRPVEEVLLTASAAEAFVLLARALRPDADVSRPLVIHPQFTEPEAALRAAGHPVRRHVLDHAIGFRLDPQRVPADADLVVIGNPTNPTSVLHPAADLAALARPGRVLVVDEAFADTVPGEPESVANRRDLPGLLVVRSLTKSWGLAGLRVGYVLGPAPLLSRLAAAQPLWAVSAPALQAIIGCSTAGARAEAESWARTLAGPRKRLVAGLRALGAHVVDPSSSFVLTRIERGDRVRAALRERGYAVRTGGTFPGLGPDWLRLAVRDTATVEAFLATLAEVVGRAPARPGYADHDAGTPATGPAPASVPDSSTPVADVLPLGLDVAGRRVVVVGAGPVGLRRVAALLHAGAAVRLVAPYATPALQDLAAAGRLQWRQRRYASSDLADAWLAFACTDDPDVSAAVTADAERNRIFCTRADDAAGGTAWAPAAGRVGPMTVAVHARRDPGRAAAVRDALVAHAGRLDLRPRRGGQGRVVLVGGGPGDPGLITVQGRAALAEADVVVVDRLAPLPVLDELPDRVHVIDAAKIPKGRGMGQDHINEVLVRAAQEGKVAVRLKGGDPFVFGRGMEEMIACRAAGVPVTVVPGVTSATAVPGLVGIPVTHRGRAQGFTVVSGHVPPGHAQSTVDWAALARGGTTLVVLMGVDTVPAIAAALIAGGLPGPTPVAIVSNGASAAQSVLRTTLDQVGTAARTCGVRAPAVCVIGDVVNAAAGSATDPH